MVSLNDGSVHQHASHGVCYAMLPLNITSATAQTIMGVWMSMIAVLVLGLAIAAPRHKAILFSATLCLLILAAGLVWGALRIRAEGKRSKDARDERLRRGGFLVSHEPQTPDAVPDEIEDRDVVSWLVEKTRVPLIAGPWVKRSQPIEAYKHFRAELEMNGLPLPRIIADERLRKKLESLPLTSDLLEPEYTPHVPQAVQAFISSMGVILTGLSMSFRPNGFGWVWTSLFAAGVLSMLAMVVHVRGRSVLLHVMAPFAPVAGLGVVQNQRRKRWVVGDSVLFVQSGMNGKHLLATLFGPQGVLRWSFKTVDHPDFVALWQRWNHPIPRPELME